MYRDENSHPSPLVPSSQILSCLESLVVVVLRTEAPSGEEGASRAYSVYWERFYAHMECNRSEGGNLIDRLFDCLDSLAPCSASCGCCQASCSSPSHTEVLIGSGDRGVLLDVTSFNCAADMDDARPDQKLALCEALQLQAEVLLAVAGVLRAVARAVAATPRRLDVDGWHSDVGMLHTIAARLFRPRCHSGGARSDAASAQPLIERLHYMGACLRRDTFSQVHPRAHNIAKTHPSKEHGTPGMPPRLCSGPDLCTLASARELY